MNREQLFTKIITQVGSGHESEYENLVREIEQREEKELCPEYKSVLAEIKNNPIDEKELAEIIKNASNGELSQFEIAAYVLGDKFLEVEEKDTEQVALLIAKVTHKVLDFRDEKNIVKKTANFEDYEPMKPVDRMKYESMLIKASKAKDKEQEKITKEINAFVCSKTNIKVEDLTDWEKSLLNEILAQEAKGISQIFLGKK